MNQHSAHSSLSRVDPQLPLIGISFTLLKPCNFCSRFYSLLSPHLFAGHLIYYPDSQKARDSNIYHLRCLTDSSSGISNTRAKLCLLPKPVLLQFPRSINQQLKLMLEDNFLLIPNPTNWILSIPPPNLPSSLHHHCCHLSWHPQHPSSTQTTATATPQSTWNPPEWVWMLLDA